LERGWSEGGLELGARCLWGGFLMKNI